MIPGYRGLISLARRSGQLKSIEARVVYANDTFGIEYGTSPFLKHVPNLTGDPGPLVLVYAVARLVDGGEQVEVMTKVQVDAIRSRSRAGKSGPWVTDYDEMARKTVVRRICKYLPLSVELAKALEIDERVESGQAPLNEVNLDAVLPPEEFVPEVVPPAKTKAADTLKAKLAAEAGERLGLDAPINDDELKF
jgi:recombinational DNA repair protein RecT